MIPIHFGFSGKADGWAERSFVLVLPFIGVALYGLLTVLRGYLTITTTRGRSRLRMQLVTTLVALQPEIAQAFPTSAAVNEALRVVLKATTVVRRSRPMRKPGTRTAPKRK